MTSTRAPVANGFLAQVIDRAYERVPLIAPRRASWFEPVDDRGPDAETAEATAPASAPRTPVAQPPAAAIAPRAIPPAVAETTVPRAVPGPLPQTAASIPALRTPVRADAMPQEQQRNNYPLQQVLPAAPASTPAAATPLTAAVALVPKAVPALQPASPPRRAEPSAGPALRESHSANATASAQPERALLQSFAASMPLARSDAAAPAASPHVTISIGRVEVRAAAAAAAPVRTAPAPRTAALADYLGRRSRTP